MKIKRPLAPDFIEKLDARLLISKPSAWSTRAHLVLYYAGAFALLIIAIGFLTPNDPRNEGNVFLWLSLLSVLCGIGFIVWIIYLLRFNVFKRFGIQKNGDGLKAYALYFVSVAILTAIPFLPPGIESIRANMAYSNEELVNDYNSISTNIVKLEYDSMVHRWERSTYQLHITDSVYSESEVVDLSDSGGARYYISDTGSFKSRIDGADSLKKINDSAYIVYECPSYIFIPNYNLDLYSKADQVSPIDIYNNVTRNFQRPDKQKVAAELKTLLDKYRVNVENASYYYGEIGVLEEGESYRERVSARYDLDLVGASLWHISEQKDRWKGDNWQTFLRVFFYITLIFSTLVFIFRHTTVKTFFLSLLTAVLLFTFTAIIFASFGTEALASFPVMLIYYLIFVALAIIGSREKTRRAIGGIALNLFTFFTPYLFLFIASWYYAYLNNLPYDTRPPDLFENQELHFVIAEIGGFVLFIVLIETVFKKLYRKWHALPEE